MVKIKGFLLKTVLTVVVSIVCVGMLSAACDTPEMKVADVSFGSSGVSFIPRLANAGMQLAVSAPDGTIFSRTFPAGSTPYFSPFDSGINSLDGIYTYELRVIAADGGKNRSETDILFTSRIEDRAMIQSGSFTVKNGALILPSDFSENRSTVDDVRHYDDVIITGSLCVGFDCADGESFSYCTIKLKENNLQICFEDTSAPTFPTNDWKIVINDTSSGGASYFSVWDTDAGVRTFTIEAGAPAHSLYIDDYGRVGLGTSIPYVELHIVDGDSPAIRLDQDGSSGWAAQRWDLCGNETNFFLRDVTNGSKLCFRVQPNTPSNTLCLRADGKVGIGTWSPAHPLEIETASGTAATFIAEQISGATAVVSADSSHVFIGAKTNHDFRLLANDSPKVTILPSGNVGIGTTSPTHLLHLSGGAYSDGNTWQNASSRKYKENIYNLTLEEAKDALNGLNPVKYNYKTNKEEDYIGFIAEDVPELVATKDRDSMNPMDVVAVLTIILKDQQKTINELKKKVSELEKK